MGKRRKSGGPAFVQVYQYLLRTEAWMDLSNGARSAFLALRSLYNGSNNGRLGLGSRMAGEKLGMSKSSAARYLRELEEHGFVRRQTLSSFHQKKLATEWALTDVRNDVTGEAPSREFQKWRRPEKNQKPVPYSAPSVPATGPRQGKALPIPKNGPADGTDGKVLRAKQSQTRDTYTSSPKVEAGETSRGSEPRNVIPLFSGLNLKGETVVSVPELSVENDLEDDPLTRAILEIFPGAKVTFRG